MSARSAARRIVSLVPSLSEALFALELGERVVGVTDWCVHPAEQLAGVPRVGGTKNPSLERILELRPDLVVANHEENTRRDVERMQKAGLDVWVTDPRSVVGALSLLGELAELGAPDAARARVIDPIHAALARAAARLAAPPTRVFCPIWKRPWMAVGSDTYADDLLRVCGGANVFADRRERRYPIVEEAEIRAAAPEVVLLPDEPYAFGARDAAELAAWDLPASRAGAIHCVDGTLVSWYGPRIARAIDQLLPLLAPAARD